MKLGNRYLKSGVGIVLVVDYRPFTHISLLGDFLLQGTVGKTALVALLVYVFVDANTPVPGKALFGEGINPPLQWKESDPDGFVVATYNIRRSKGEDGVRDISRSARVLQDADIDIVGLNELSGTLFYGLTDQAEQLGRLMGAGWLFAPTYRQFFQDHFGNGLISRFSIDSWRINPLLTNEDHDDSYRNMIVASLMVSDTEVHILNTHLDRSRVRSRQLHQVLEHFRGLPSPAILIGDLNTRHDDEVLAEFLEDPLYVDATHSIDPEHDVEWIISKGLTVVSGGMEPVGVSDHPAYWVKFKILTAR